MSRSILMFVLATSVPGVASAVPAEVLLVVDTSASMAEPAEGGGQTKLDVARRIAGEVAAAASRQRVGLVRFAQNEVVAPGGAGPIVVRDVDEAACETRGNLLVPLSTEGAAEVARWVDGTDAAGNPELMALGESPLFGTLELAFAYVRERRRGNPGRSCVNAVLVVLTDGADTCAGEAVLREGLADLARQGTREDIRTIVLSFDTESEIAQLVARIGRGEEAPHLYGAGEAADLVAEVAALEGRLSPEACFAVGVPPEDTCRRTSAALRRTEPPRAGGCTLAGAPGAASVWGLFGLALVLGLGRSRRAILGAALLALLASGCACGDDDDAGPGDDAGADAGEDAGSDGGSPVCDPEGQLAVGLARLDAILDAVQTVRDEEIHPLLDPASVYAAIEGDPVAGCLALARSFGFEPYRGAQRGSAGCLASGRCNGFDRSILLTECLHDHGVEAAVHNCWTPPQAMDALRARALEPSAAVDLSAANQHLREAVESAAAAEPGFLAEIDRVAPLVDEWAATEMTTHPATDAAGLAVVPGIDAALTADTVATRETDGLGVVYYVETDTGNLDPVLDGEPVCTGGPADAANDAMRITLRVDVRYADPAGARLSFEPATTVAELDFAVHQLSDPVVTVAIVDASVDRLPDGIPESSSGCLRAILRAGGDEVGGGYFFIGVGDDAACPGAPVVPAQDGRHLASIALYVTTHDPQSSEETVRTLVDRYGYGMTEEGMRASGPMFSDASARELLPMRADILVAGGLPGPVWVADRVLGSLVARRDELAARQARALGLPVAEAPPDPMLPLGALVLGLVRRHASAIVPDGALLWAESPVLVSVVQRRGIRPGPAGLAIAAQRILDVLAAPLIVSSQDLSAGASRARLDAQRQLGALVTEAERMVILAADKAALVVNTGAMFRDASTGEWGPYGSPGHEAALFPLAVQDVAYFHDVRGRTLVSTPGPASYAGTEVTAWWKLDEPTGVTLGEVRYEGTFYGGAAGVKLIADIDRCIWSASSDALAGSPTSEEEMVACYEGAERDFVFSLLTDFLTGAIGAAGAALDVGGTEIALGATVDEITGGLGALESAGNIANAFNGVSPY